MENLTFPLYRPSFLFYLVCTPCTPTLDILKKIAAYFNVTTDYLLGVSDVKRDIKGQMKVNETLDAYYDLVEVYKDLDPYDQEMIWSIIQTVKKISDKRKKDNMQTVEK